MGSPPPLSPFAPKALPHAAPVEGVRLAVAEAGIRYKGRKDLMVAVLEPGTVVAGVLTKSKTRSAPVDWCAAQLRHGRARALVVNSGNANAFTGKRGREAVEITAAAAAEAVGCAPEEVLLASTGVIGEPMDAGGFSHLLQGLASKAVPDALLPAAQAIMTTDTYPKLVSATVDMDGVPVRVAGFAKGAGMIAPDMATMLAFIFTDAPIEPSVLQPLMRDAAERSFNAVTIDGDTSTSDTFLLFATGAAGRRGAPRIGLADDPRLESFRAALHDLALDLALQVVKDGEGATKFVEISVTGAEDDKAARIIARSIANSPLVKTALAGEDPNWGRIVMAVGKAGERADRDKLAIFFGDIAVARDGAVAPEYREDVGAAYMKGAELKILVDVGVGDGKSKVWTCDLTHDYISINADYRS